jgi:hypothetical protein
MVESAFALLITGLAAYGPKAKRVFSLSRAARPGTSASVLNRLLPLVDAVTMAYRPSNNHSLEWPQSQKQRSPWFRTSKTGWSRKIGTRWLAVLSFMHSRM